MILPIGILLIGTLIVYAGVNDISVSDALGKLLGRQPGGKLGSLTGAPTMGGSATGASGVSGLVSSGGFTFPMSKSAAVSPDHWTQDQGVDIAAPGHTPLVAVKDGIVVKHGIGGFGNYAPVLAIGGGKYVYYGHAGPGNSVSIGTHVTAGQVIGEVGAGIFGISTGPHLEIGFSDANGTPVPGTSGEMLGLLHSSYGA